MNANTLTRTSKPVDIKNIKQIVELMKASELTEFELEDSGFKLRITRDKGTFGAPVVQATPAVASEPTAGAPAPTPAASAPADDNLHVITSPMVGTFYRSPSPESPAFVDVGAKVGKDSAVCIVEAMKVMNEIQTDVSGTIVEILVDNEQTVEFGQPLFKVKPS